MFLNLYLKRKERETSREVPQSQTGALPRPQSSVKYGFRYNLLQECIQTDVIFLYQRTVSAIISKTPYKEEVNRKVQGVPNHKPQPFPHTKRKRKQRKPNKRKSNNRTKRLALYSRSEIIAMLKGLKNARTK